MSNPRIPYRMASDRKRLAPPRSGKPLIVHIVVNVENTLDLNDGPLWAGWGMHSDVQYERTLWTLETFEAELRENYRVMVLPLHPHLVGVPHRMNWFAKILDLLLARRDTVFLNGGQIADWYEKVEPAPH